MFVLFCLSSCNLFIKLGLFIVFFLRFLGFPHMSQCSYPIGACAVMSFHSIFPGPPTFILVARIEQFGRQDLVFVE